MVISLHNIKKSYSNGKNSKREILTGINLEIEKGELIAISGPSGSGKTTLLNIIGKMDEPDSGSIIVNGKELSELNTFKARKTILSSILLIR